MSIVNHLYVNNIRVVCKGPSEVGDKCFLISTLTGAGHPGTNQQGADRVVGPKSLLNERGQSLGRLLDAGPLWIGARPPPINSPQTLPTLCEKRRIGTTSIEANDKAFCRHGR